MCEIVQNLDWLNILLNLSHIMVQISRLFFVHQLYKRPTQDLHERTSSNFFLKVTCLIIEVRCSIRGSLRCVDRATACWWHTFNVSLPTHPHTCSANTLSFGSDASCVLTFTYFKLLWWLLALPAPTLPRILACPLQSITPLVHLHVPYVACCCHCEYTRGVFEVHFIDEWHHITVTDPSHAHFVRAYSYAYTRARVD